jgi:hypothetical protein
MAFTDLLFGRKGTGPQLDVPLLQAALVEGVTRHAGQPVDAELVRARLADRCRDAELTPLLPEEFDGLAADLDEETWRRLAMLVGLLDRDDVRTALAAVAAVRGLLGVVVDAAFVGLARQTPLLTLELLRQSPLRVEELARRFVAALGAGVRGESAKVSKERLERLDYERLLREAARAKEAAAERMKQLRKLQEEHEQRGPRRGKW